MTLVVSEISRHGIVMVGDSAVTRDRHVLPDYPAQKIQYCAKINAGLAMWGKAFGLGIDMDKWIARFLENDVHRGDGLEEVGNRLADSMNTMLIATGLPWGELVRGFHLTGFVNGLPRLWHVHCGHPTEGAHELRLYKDFPEDNGIPESKFEKDLYSGQGFMLRNGFFRLYTRLYDSLTSYSASLRKDFKIDFPGDSLEGRIKFQQMLVRFVSDVLDATGRERYVNDQLSVVAFDRHGIIEKQTVEINGRNALDQMGYDISYSQ